MSSSMSLLRAPAATGRRGAELTGPAEPKSPPASSEKLPPPPPRLSSMVRLELKPCSTTSVEYFSAPLWSVHLRVCNAPSMYTLAPFFRYCSATLASPSLKITTRCHSVFSLRSPVALSRQVSDVATLKLAIGWPSWVRRISGSLPRFQTRITLFTLPAMPLSTKIRVGQSELSRERDPIRSGKAAGLPLTGLSTYSTEAADVPVLFLICSALLL